MKWLFYLLLLVNLAFFAWNRSMDSGAEAPAPVAHNTAGASRLVLLHELPPSDRSPVRQDAKQPAPPAEKERPDVTASAPSAAEPPAAEAGDEGGSGTASPPPAKEKTSAESGSETAQAPAPVCYRVGGIADKQGAYTLAARLEASGATILQRGNEPGTRTNYWVFLPPFPSRAAARPAIRLLQKSGFKDYYLVRAGENENAVSLGVFSERSRAERRYRQIRGYGLKPQLDELALPIQNQWVSFRWPPSKPAPPPSDLFVDLQAKPPTAFACP